MSVLKVAHLRRCDDIPSMLRSLANDIENGLVNAQEVMCVVRCDVNTVKLYGWGDYRGNISALGLLESAKRVVDIAVDEQEVQSCT